MHKLGSETRLHVSVDVENLYHQKKHEYSILNQLPNFDYLNYSNSDISGMGKDVKIKIETLTEDTQWISKSEFNIKLLVLLNSQA